MEGIDAGQGQRRAFHCSTHKYSNEYDLTGGGADISFTLTMKPPVEKALEEKTVQQAIETIRDRVDSLGVSEPMIAAVRPGRQPDSGGAAGHRRP